ncbi:hypothetical protein BGZ68_003798 [Mortierella alpina]|nr:hypothetical protein BGZ68_003798 [Mortierella alpina]
MEMLCGSGPESFDVLCGLTRNPINSHHQIAACEENPDRLIGAFFDLNYIKDHCLGHGMTFSRRMTFVDEDTVRLHGISIEGDRGRDMMKKKKSDQNESGASKWEVAARELGYSHHEAKHEADKCSQELETLQQKIYQQQELYNNYHRKQIFAKRQLQHTIRSHSKHESIEARREVFHQERHAAHEAMIQLMPLQRKKQEIRDKRYTWNKIAEASSAAAAPSSPSSSTAPSRSVRPTWESPGALAPTPMIDMTVMKEALVLDPARKIAITGGDPGLVVQLTTIYTTLDQLKAHANYYECL